MKLKMDGITSLTAARWAAASGFDYIGFVFDTAAPGYMSPMKVSEIAGWVSGPARAGRFLDSTPQTVADIATMLDLGLLEVSPGLAAILPPYLVIPRLLLVTESESGSALDYAAKDPLVIGIQILEQTPPFTWNGHPDLWVHSGFRGLQNDRIPAGVFFNAIAETETGILDFENMENDLDFWRKYREV